ncbi:hypothetical protein BE11_33845 [Sorangium cellulosum]|nr:hypothetical protein BE11_33845 [Sorangium cellulosum]
MRRQALIAVTALGLLGAACSSDPGFEGAKAPKVEAARNADGSLDDRSMCEWKGRADREASETAGPGAIQPNVRRVWQIVGTGEDRHRALVCREIDTNFDGVKDVVRRYNDKGESLHEESDANYDGRIDTWLTFASGRLAEARIDSDRDGNPDEWKYYSGGKLARIKRDTNRDGKPDVWEIYRMGRLERMGVDIDADERVDRWDHDNELRRRLEDDERRKEEEAAAKKAAEDRSAADKADEAVDGSGSAGPSGNKK